ncbi:MAG: SDR family NAD(P)-dependent oxidoreductase [Cyanobacteria bacterium SBLK]|nr:SDR family NAD(P)-dependent oxidoreductase [Cyanobacteria bacterium SBLK]
MSATYTGLEIAVIGLSGRFPGSDTIEDFWKNLANGVELISTFDESPSDTQPIRAGSVLEGVDRFDADFFGFNPREAQMMDPQHRLFLECAWEALENAGYSSPTEKRSTGIFAGVGMGTYLLYNLSPTPGLLESQGFLSTLVGVDKDYLPTRVSYKLNLKGPSMSVGTACSSSLVAVHLACQSLLGGECDMALGAGVAVKVPQSSLTLAPDEIISSDGHCRAFDRDATGTVGGNGIGVVVLKRLEDAIADGDTIYAIIKGSAVNNDGARKVGYTAPSEEGQTRVIRTAQMMAEVEPDSIGYMEAHGTGTPLGDPIEIAAMTKAFREKCDGKGFCATGSVKTNVGHLDAAAGIAGFLKTVLALHHQQIPPSLNFKTPNPQIDFENSPFYVNAQLKDWQRNGTPRRAGVSSFGFGGTNVHVVLEEAPSPAAETPANCPQLLSLSAKTATALETMSDRLVNHLKASPDLNLADVAGTLHLGRWQLPHRRAFVAQTVAEAVEILEAGGAETREAPVNGSPVIFMFPGQGSQYVNMGRKLYEREAKFREVCDRCFARLKLQHDLDLPSILFPTAEADIPVFKEKLTQTAIAQPALFVIEYALAQLWISWGIIPQAAIGHSIGEYVAACVAGVFSLDDALDLVTARGRLMQQQPPGSMTAARLSAEEVRPFLHDSLCIAASNSPSLTVVSGTAADIERLQSKLASQDIDCIPLHVSHAFHSPLMEGAIAPFLEQLQRVKLNPPKIPFIANVTGTWITDEQAMDPQYWGRQLRQSVQFSAGIGELLQNSEGIFLETGPGRTLSTLTRQQAKEQTILCSLPHPKDPVDDGAFLLQTAGRLWLEGVAIDWSSFYGDRPHRRIPLPTYPFDRQRYWIDPPGSDRSTLEKNPELADWFYVPAWKHSVLPAIATDCPQGSWVIFSDSSGLGTALGQRLQQMGHRVVWVTPGEVYGRGSEDVYTLDPGDREHYEALIRDVESLDSSLVFAHLWTVAPDLSLEEASRSGFYSLLYLAQALEQTSGDRRDRLCVISSQVEDVTGRETLCPEKATIVGPCRVIPQEYANIACDRIDIDLADFQGTIAPQFLDRLVTEMLAQTAKPADAASAVLAYRGNYRWELTYDSFPLKADNPSAFRTGGTYLITGGTGGIGLEIAAFLAEKVQANLILVSRSTFPDREDWDDWLAKAEDSCPQAAKIRKLQAIEASGGKVLVSSADVCDGEAMQAVCDRARTAFGEIHGVFHAAGIPGGGIISLKTREMAEKVMASKIEGTRVLDRIFSDTPLDFLVLFSSLSALVGGAGQADYCAANAYLDAFARGRSGERVVAIDWDTWQEVGMSVDTADLPEHLKARRLEALEAGIAPKEGLEALDRILQRGLERVVVSTKALQEVLAERHDLSAMAEGVETEASPTPQPEHQRRIQSTAYVAPRNAIEEWIVQLWQEQIGFSPIGVNDNFFELGGHSLLAVRVMAKLREHYSVDLSLRVLLSEAPTVAGLAGSVAEQFAPPDESNLEDSTETARLLAEIENLSLDEVQEQLQQETTPL